MASTKDISIEKAKSLINILRQAGIDVSDAYLFGSVVKDLASDDSDIDLALVSRDFNGIRYHDIKKISKYRRKVDLRLEVHPFNLQEIEKDPPHFFLKIQKEGLRIQV